MTTPRLCIPLCASRLDILVSHIKHASAFADLIELRLDCLAPEEFRLLEDHTRLAQLLDCSTLPTILTLRAAEQGGHTIHTEIERARFWENMFRSAAESQITLVDIELDLLEAHLQGDGAIDLPKVICSHHEWTKSDKSPDEIYRRARVTGARIVKLAVTAEDAIDCLPLFRLLRQARGEEVKLIAIAMGTAGLLTRILAPSRGSFLTFAALDEKAVTAPGQLTAEELRDIYRVHTITKATALTGLIGSPVAHSLSPQMHNRAFVARGVDAVYIPLEVHDLAAFLRRMVRAETREVDFNWRGFSVTAPHKEAVIKHLDWVDEAARDIGAVNTIVIEKDALHGYNTDAAAVLTPVEAHVDLRAARVAVIGAGGAARAALWGLRQKGARTTIFARDIKRAREVSGRFDAALAPLGGAQFDGYDLVINTTPLGTWKADGAHEHETPALAHQLRGARIIYDLVYNPSQTAFMREGEAAGCRSIGGLEMLIGQAAAQWELWMKVDAPIDVMRHAAKERLKP